MVLKKLPLYHLFQRLRQEAGIELGPEQYALFLKAFLSGYGTGSKVQLKQLCQTLWVPRNRYLEIFDTYFEQAFNRLDYDLNIAGGDQHRIFQTDRSIDPAVSHRNDSKSEQEQKKEIKEQRSASEKTTDADAGKSEGDQAMPGSSYGDYVDIFLQFKEEGHGAAYAPTEHEHASEITDHPFLFSAKHLPLTRRKMQQQWRYVRAYSVKRRSTTLDIKATIDRIGKEKFLQELEYQTIKINQQHLVFLVDHARSMIAFDQIGQHLIETIRESGRHQDINTYYFQTLPVPNNKNQEEAGSHYHLYLNKAHSYSVSLQQMLREADKRHSILLLFSDAGAAQKKLSDPKRVYRTLNFLKKINRGFSKIVWINPMPRTRWAGTPAEAISYFVDMVEATDRGLMKAIDLIKRI